MQQKKQSKIKSEQKVCICKQKTYKFILYNPLHNVEIIRNEINKLSSWYMIIWKKHNNKSYILLQKIGVNFQVTLQNDYIHRIQQIEK